MKREFIINILILLVINAFIKMAYLFVVEVEVQNTVGPEQYGIFLALFNFTYIFQFFNDPGIHTFNTTLIAGQPERVSFHLAHVTGVKCLTGIIFLLVISLVALLMNYDMSIYPILLLVAFNQILSSYLLYLRSHFSALGIYRMDSYVSALDKFFMLLVIGVLLLSFKETFAIGFFIGGQTFSFLLAIGVIHVLLSRYVKPEWPVFSLSYTKNLISRSLPFALVLLFMAAYSRMDAVMIERLLPEGNYQAGIYAAAYRYMDAASMVMYLFASLLLPMYARSLNDQRTIQELTDTAVRGAGILCLMISSMLVIYFEKWMSLYTHYDEQYSMLIFYQMLAFYCIGIAYIYGTLMASGNKLLHLNILFGMGVILNFCLNYYLIPRNMATGAALATFITQACMGAGQILLAHRIFKLPFNITLAVKFCLLGFVTIVFSVLVRDYTDVFWIFGIVFSLLIIAAISFLLKILKKDFISGISVRMGS
ncbi:MAG TPA: oligosaccharide flippase family protein [Saprospiraceae bacterium]|nr:oligosaccharide flippase family protein [Saprospiraceae bacterium]